MLNESTGVASIKNDSISLNIEIQKTDMILTATTGSDKTLIRLIPAMMKTQEGDPSPYLRVEVMTSPLITETVGTHDK